MVVLDPGHDYLLKVYDGDTERMQRLTFMKREGDKYPGNVGAYPGTNMQEVLRALIDRTGYLNAQQGCEENTFIMAALRVSIRKLEERAARRHGRILDLDIKRPVELLLTCGVCGHIDCGGKH